MTTAQTPAQRRALRMRAVFAEGRNSGLGTDDVRSLARQLIGCGLSEATLAQLDQVLGALKRGKRREGGNEWAFVFGAPADRQTLLKKLYRQAQRLGALQQPPVPVMPKHYMEGLAARMMGAATRLEFCDAAQLHKLVQAVQVHLDRHGG